MLLLGVTGDHHRARREAGEQEHQRGGLRVFRDLFNGQGEPENPGSRASELLRDAEARQSGLDEELEQVLRILLAGIDLPRPGRDPLLCEFAARGSQLVELG